MIIKDPEKYFFACNGAVLKSYEELVDFMCNIDDGVFYHHVTNDRNDFAAWTKAVLKMSAVSSKMNKAKDREAMIKILTAKKGGKKTIISRIKKAIKNG